MIKTVIAILSLVNAHRFYSYYLTEDREKSRRMWWSFIIFICAVVVSGVFLRDKILPEEATSGPVIKFVMKKIWLPVRVSFFDRYWIIWFLSCGVGISVIEIVFKKQLSRQDGLVHGPKVFDSGRLTRGAEAIVAGRMRRDVLPAPVRKFIWGGSDEIRLPFNRLSRGVTILGDMGCGKSRLMYLIVQEIIKRYPEIPILIHDPKGEWLRTFYDEEKDLIFAPFDRRSCAWSIWCDFLEHPELVHAVISTAVTAHHSGAGHDRFWTDSAITLLEDISGEDSIYNAKKNLKKLYKKNADNKTWASIYTTAVIGLRDIANVELMNQRNLESGRESRSIDEFLRHPGKIFLLNNPSIASEQHGALTLLLSAFMIRVLSGSDVKEDQLRACVVMDEALTFNLPEDVERAVFTQSRSKGLAVIAGAQRIPRHNQGERGAWADHPAFLFGMRVSDLETRGHLTKRLGEIRYEKKQKSKSISDKSQSQTESIEEKRQEIMAPEDWALGAREFILFSENGFAPGRTRDVDMEQREIPIIDYDPRRDVAKFMNMEG